MSGRNLWIVTPIPSSPAGYTKPCKYFVNGDRRPQDPDVEAIPMKQAGPIENDVVVPLVYPVCRSLQPDDAQVITSSRRARTTVDLLLASTPRLE